MGPHAAERSLGKDQSAETSWSGEMMKSRILLIVFVLLIVFGLSAIAVIWNRKSEKPALRRITTTQIRSEIDQHIPIGSSRTRVVEYLDERKIAHSYYEASGDRDGNYSNSEIALVPRTGSSGLVTTDIQIVFRFDENMKLASYQVQEINKGP
jgi:hypothetical protein